MMFNSFLNKIKVKIAVLSAFVMALTCLGGCGNQPASGDFMQPAVTSSDTGFVLYGPYDYDSTDTAVLVNKDTEGATLTFLNYELGKRYTLGYDGTTGFYDRYGQLISLSQLTVGDIVDLRFVKEKRHLHVGLV